jgi:hypothetical protein
MRVGLLSQRKQATHWEGKNISHLYPGIIDHILFMSENKRGDRLSLKSK